MTPKWERHLTRINKFDPNARVFDLIGELQNQDDRPVAVRIYGGECKLVDEFLRCDAGGAETSVAGSSRL